MLTPASAPTERSEGPPVSRTRSASIGPRVGFDARDAPCAVRPGRRAQPGERRPLAQVDPGRLHRERVGADVARWIDRAVAGPEAPAAVAGRRQGDGPRRCLGRLEPLDVEPVRTLHRDTLATGALVLVGHGEDEVAEPAKPGIGAVGGALALVERHGPAPERDRRRRAALGADDAGGP